MSKVAPGIGRIVRFTSDDGTSLYGTLYGDGFRDKSCVLIAGGLGVPQRFYSHFATFLSEHNHLVMTFDLRGMGDSRLPEHRRSLRGVNADMLTWARQDFAAAVSYLSGTAPSGTISLIGHSLGMHHAAMTTRSAQEKIKLAVSVAAGSGYWKDWAATSRFKAPLLLHVAAPLLTPLFGYFPGKRLRMVGDLPAPAIKQWSMWCRHPGFAWGAQPELVLPSLRSARFPVHAYSFADDEAMTTECTRKLLAAMPNAPSTQYLITPSEVNLQSIGHIGAFRSEAKEALWSRFESHLSLKTP